MRRYAWLCVWAALAAPLPAHAGDLPDAATTPGATDPTVNQQDIRQTICVRGYTRGVRPPVTYTNRLKRRQMRHEHLMGSSRDYEEDHLISLEIGGSIGTLAGLILRKTLPAFLIGLTFSFFTWKFYAS